MKKYVFRSETRGHQTNIYPLGVPSVAFTFNAYAVHLADIKSNFEAHLQQRLNDGHPVPDPVTAEDEIGKSDIDYAKVPGHYFFELAIQTPA